MKNLRKFPEQKPRVETGPIQFGNDWPGIFVRGDDAFFYSQMIQTIISHNDLDIIDKKSLMDLKKLFDRNVLK